MPYQSHRQTDLTCFDHEKDVSEDVCSMEVFGFYIKSFGSFGKNQPKVNRKEKPLNLGPDLFSKVRFWNSGKSENLQRMRILGGGVLLLYKLFAWEPG